jgi:DNA polymerase-3 subunit delta'
MSDDIPEPDRLEGAPHPRDCVRLIGQEAAEAEFLNAHLGGRMHHGWLLTGPRGVGKATLAWRIARFLLATPEVEAETEAGLFGAAPAPASLDIAPDHPVARRMAAKGEGRLYHLTRTVNDKTGKLHSEIVVDDMRRMKQFFTLSAPDGGRRVAIVDCADEMTVSAANALLKLLEEPPDRVIILLVSHRPSGLLPTIRSRCRVLRLGQLGPGNLAEAMRQAGVDPPGQEAALQALTELAGGSVGASIRLVHDQGLAAYARLVEAFDTMPGAQRPMLLALAEMAQGKGAETGFDLLLGLIDLCLARLARRGASGQSPPEAAPGEARMLARLAPDARAGRVWAEVAQDLGLRARRGRGVNLDAAALILDLLLRIDTTAARLVAR